MSTESNAASPPVAELSYEQARDELVAIVARIEGGNASLEESMQLWDRGEALAAHCQAKLDQAQEQLDRAGAPEASASEGATSAAAATDGGESTTPEEGAGQDEMPDA